MNTIARAFDIEPPIRSSIDAEQRRINAEAIREMAVVDKCNEIIDDPEQLDDAIGDFGNALSFTGLFQLLSNIARCETAEQYITQGSALKEHVRAMARWYADQQVKPVSVFLLRQAD